MKQSVSLVIPLFNEADTIGPLISSIAKQSLLATEVILVDGGSTDTTVEVIRSIEGSTTIPIKLIEAGRAMPGRGRNIGTAAAKTEWIAYTDAGIKLDENWLKKLFEAAENDPTASIVYGNYSPEITSTFSKAAAITYVSAAKKHLIRGKSIASCLIKKEVWEKAGGFPDWRAAEDLAFMEKAENLGFTFTTAPQANIQWKLSPGFYSTFKKFDMYTKYNVWAGRGTKWFLATIKQYLIIILIAIVALFFSPWLLLGIPFFFMLRTAKRIYQHKVEFGLSTIFNPSLFVQVLLLSIVIDAAVFLGFAKAKIQGSHDWRSKRMKG